MQLTCICEPDPFVVWADRWDMQHVLMNLLSNATDACEGAGKVTIRAHIDTEAQLYVLTVTDTGCGMAAEEVSQAFEPLYSTKAWGTGLGLSLCRQLLEQQGGKITLDSQKGHGTTVTLLLPVLTSLAHHSTPGNTTPAGDAHAERR
jgi:signal transduction histidine kinase